jgi:S-adenosylmethionine:tRNA ribosyltransferase-isomerase
LAIYSYYSGLQASLCYYYSQMLLSEFDYALPADRIAQKPAEDRSSSRMLQLDRNSGRIEDGHFRDLPSLLNGNELMVVNNVRVIPARLFGHRAGILAEPPGKHGPRGHLSSRIEVLLTRRIDSDVWEALVRPGRKVGTGEKLFFEGAALEAEVIWRGGYGLRQLRFRAENGTEVSEAINRAGHVPLPPYIRRSDEGLDRDRYQTVFAKHPAAVAAPTAGLHFTPAILSELRQKGIEIVEITLEVGLGTFQPIRSETLEDHVMHSEAYQISEGAAAAITSARHQNRPILAVGTTVVRALEDAAQKSMAVGRAPETIAAGRTFADIFIRPGHRFLVIDQLLTNFHLPRSTLLALVCAFAGREIVLSAYRHAVASDYRFYSYGDCMLIL